MFFISRSIQSVGPLKALCTQSLRRIVHKRAPTELLWEEYSLTKPCSHILMPDNHVG